MTKNQIIKMKDTQFGRDLQAPLIVNSTRTSRARYNAIICRGEVQLFSKGIQPSRHWRLKYVKDYFGLSGSKQKVAEQLDYIVNNFTLIESIIVN
jgi:hypothetical protein